MPTSLHSCCTTRRGQWYAVPVVQPSTHSATAQAIPACEEVLAIEPQGATRCTRGRHCAARGCNRVQVAPVSQRFLHSGYRLAEVVVPAPRTCACRCACLSALSLWPEEKRSLSLAEQPCRTYGSCKAVAPPSVHRPLIPPPCPIDQPGQLTPEGAMGGGGRRWGQGSRARAAGARGRAPSLTSPVPMLVAVPTLALVPLALPAPLFSVPPPVMAMVVVVVVAPGCPLSGRRRGGGGDTPR